MIEKDFWILIECINWNKLSRNENANDLVRDYLLSCGLSKSDLINFKDFVDNSYRVLKSLVSDNRIKLGENVPEELNIGDDTAWDICAHVVGLGKDFYYAVLKNINLIKTVRYTYKENFTYGISKALEEYEKEE